MPTIKLRRGTATEWSTANPLLAAGEPGFETDSGKHKIGDGVARWSKLPYFLHETQVTQTIDKKILDSTADVRQTRLSRQVSSSNATQWIPVPELAITNARSGEVWFVELHLAYQAVGAAAGAGIQLRLRSGSTAIDTSWLVDGSFSGLTVPATTTTNDQLTKVIRYPARSGLDTAHGGAGPDVDARLEGKFRIVVGGAGADDRVIGFDMKQRNANGSEPTLLLPGSFVVFSRAI
jgi:hypothetical protein